METSLNLNWLLHRIKKGLGVKSYLFMAKRTQVRTLKVLGWVKMFWAIRQMSRWPVVARWASLAGEKQEGDKCWALLPPTVQLQFNAGCFKSIQWRTCTTVQFNGSVQCIFEGYIRLWLVGWMGTFPAYCRASSLVNVWAWWEREPLHSAQAHAGTNILLNAANPGSF